MEHILTVCKSVFINYLPSLACGKQQKFAKLFNNACSMCLFCMVVTFHCVTDVNCCADLKAEHWCALFCCLSHKNGLHGKALYLNVCKTQFFEEVNTPNFPFSRPSNIFWCKNDNFQAGNFGKNDPCKYLEYKLLMKAFCFTAQKCYRIPFVPT